METEITQILSFVTKIDGELFFTYEDFIHGKVSGNTYDIFTMTDRKNLLIRVRGKDFYIFNIEEALIKPLLTSAANGKS